MRHLDKVKKVLHKRKPFKLERQLIPITEISQISIFKILPVSAQQIQSGASLIKGEEHMRYHYSVHFTCVMNYLSFALISSTVTFIV